MGGSASGPGMIHGRHATDGRRRSHLERMIVRHGGRMVVVDFDTVRWIEAAANYLRLHTADRAYMVRMKMSDLQEQLDPDRFARVHRSAIVHMRYAKSFTPAGSRTYDITLDNGAEVRMSSRYSRGVLSYHFAGYKGVA